MKVLYSTATGYCLWAKRLEQGRFRVPSTAAGQRALTLMDLQLLIDGIEVQKYRQLKRFIGAQMVGFRYYIGFEFSGFILLKLHCLPPRLWPRKMLCCRSSWEPGLKLFAS
jgi:hypothetical protein